MKKNNSFASSFILALILCCLAEASHSQYAGKFKASLEKYGVSLAIDTAKWRRVTYQEMATRYRQHNMNFDDYLKEQKAVALFIFVPKDSLEINDQTSITIEIDSISGSTGNSPVTRDTIESSKIPLQKLRGGMKDKRDYGPAYFDKTTNSLITKNSVLIVKRGQLFDEKSSPVEYLVVQKKEIGRRRITIEYRCFTKDEEQYFPLFQKIISSFR